MHNSGGSETWKEIISGGTAGIMARSLTSPLDVLKIRVQESEGRLSMIKITKDLLQKEGVRALWKGNTAGILLYASYSAIQFSAYETMKKYENLTAGSAFINGGIAALTATTVTYPFDLLRTRMTISREKSSVLRHAENIFKGSEGIAGLFKGYTITVSQVVPYMGCVFAFHKVASRFTQSDFVAGALAGFTCKSLFMPIDVFRRRLQIYKSDPSIYSINQLTYVNSTPNKLDLLRKMWVKEGIRAFYRGWTMAVLKSTAVTAISFSIHKVVKDLLG